MRTSRQSLLTTLAPLVDGLIVTCASALAYFTRWGEWQMPLEYFSVLILGTGLALVILPATGAYLSWRNEMYWRNSGSALPGVLLVAALLMLAGTFTKTTAEFSRLWMAYWFTYAMAGIFLFRRMAFFLANLAGEPGSIRVLIVGEGKFAQTVAQKARESRDAKWEIADIVSLYGSGARVANSEATLHSYSELESIVYDRDSGIDEVWIAFDNVAPNKHEAVIRVLQTSSLPVRYIPDLSMLALLNHVPSEVAGMTMIDLNASPLAGYNTLLKAAVDKLLSIAALVLLGPLFALIALGIKLDSPGPVFFMQKRHGWDGRVIQVLKFRTMHHTGPPSGNAPQASLNDPRITRFGRILRKTSLDELPQFINVLRGDMSVVGPRPHPVDLNRSYASRIDAYMQRHRVKPGITGWAQIHGYRGETGTLEKMQRRIDYDLYYIEHWSLWLDIKIIFLTMLAGWTGTNAY